MDKNRIEGAGKQAAGSIKEAVGKITGNRATEAEGAAEKAAGKVQSGVGRAKDGVRSVLKR
ncbi:CsbD family protein [Aureimonas leprariae]|uniref:CsbD family protein n=1 Tax=Plantimonas leprariae TaxID=2615207 RepID=A0A7V7PKB9_9HYPH|nr:CsbD family protein [Aureimonas leprariae]KAB0676184.1 CsbD family protein [Aureimonas leprariae]